jgi:hypothetical protein
MLGQFATIALQHLAVYAKLSGQLNTHSKYVYFLNPELGWQIQLILYKS